MRHTDRSRTELDFTCPRARYWAYEHEGIGLAPMVEAKELAFGKAIAEQLQRIKQGQAFELSAFGEERALAEALLLGYRDVVWPRWQREYELVAAEKECPLQLTDWLIYHSRPDTITRRKVDKTLWYGPEDKTTAWLDSLLMYAGNVQLHATAFCIEHHLPGQEVTGCLVQGLYKGFNKEGKLFHPLVWGYVKEGIPGITPDQWSVKWQRGWDRAPFSQYPGGVEGWLKKCGEEVLLQVFPNSQPVMINRPLAQKYLEQVENREQEILEFHSRNPGKVDAQDLCKTFPQNFSQCDQFSKGRQPCPWKDLCFSPTVQRFPLTYFKRRTPHHEGEKEAV